MSRRALGSVAAIALLARVGYVVVFMRGYRPESDAHSYYAIGRAVSEGRGYVFTLPFEFVHATAIRPPLYPTLIAGAFRIFGTSVGVAQGVNIVAGTAAAVLAAVIGSRIGGPRAGLGAGILVALYPPLIANDVTVLVESVAVLLLLASVLLLLDGRTLLAGVALGLLMLDRASAQWFVVVIAVWVLWRFGWRDALRLVVVALLVISPWVVRNWVHVGGPVLVATNGFNLNATYSNEARLGHGFVDAYLDPRFAPMRARASDEVNLDAQLRTKALHDLRAHPARLPHVVGVNVAQWLELQPGRNRSPEALDGRNMGARNWTLPLFYAVTAGGLFALWRARRSAAAQLLALTAAYFSVVCVLSIAVPRLRSLFDACMAVAAGVALAWLIDRRVTVKTEPPPVRTLRVAHSTVIVGVLALTVGISGLVWRADTQRRARDAVTSALTRNGASVDALLAQYRASRSAHEPPRLSRQGLDQLRDLMTVLGDRAPQVAGSEKRRVADALRAVRVASHEADVIALLSAAEYLQADGQHRAPSLGDVRARYETTIRPADPTLESWDTATAGTSLETVAASIKRLPQ